MENANLSRKDIGVIGENVASEYLRRHGFSLVDKNVSRKTGEIDLIMKRNDILHFIEVKSVICNDFPNKQGNTITYDPSSNIHREKIRKIIRTSEWYIANSGWEGEWQVDAALVWLRLKDRMGRVEYLPQIA